MTKNWNLQQIFSFNNPLKKNCRIFSNPLKKFTRFLVLWKNLQDFYSNSLMKFTLFIFSWSVDEIGVFSWSSDKTDHFFLRDWWNLFFSVTICWNLQYILCLNFWICNRFGNNCLNFSEQNHPCKSPPPYRTLHEMSDSFLSNPFETQEV